MLPLQILFLAVVATAAEEFEITFGDGDRLTSRHLPLTFRTSDDAVRVRPCLTLAGVAATGDAVVHSGCGEASSERSLNFFLPDIFVDGPLGIELRLDDAPSVVSVSCMLDVVSADAGNVDTGAAKIALSDLIWYRGDGTCRGEDCSDDDDADVGRQDFFDSIYMHGFWKSSDARVVSSSGAGSDIVATANVREALTHVIQRFGVRSILDLACGDMTWMPLVLDELQAPILYTGADISPYIIEKVGARFADRSDMTFTVLDAVSDVIPHGHNLIFCRHMMFHLTGANNLKVFERIEASGARLFMATTHIRADENGNLYALAAGHNVNLFKAPYCLKDPMVLFRDDVRDRFLGLWALNPEEPLVGEC